MLHLQWGCLLSLRRMQGTDALEYLAHCGSLGRIGKPLADVPLGQGGQALFEGGQVALRSQMERTPDGETKIPRWRSSLLVLT